MSTMHVSIMVAHRIEVIQVIFWRVRWLSSWLPCCPGPGFDGPGQGGRWGGSGLLDMVTQVKAVDWKHDQRIELRTMNCILAAQNNGHSLVTHKKDTRSTETRQHNYIGTVVYRYTHTHIHIHTRRCNLKSSSNSESLAFSVRHVHTPGHLFVFYLHDINTCKIFHSVTQISSATT